MFPGNADPGPGWFSPRRRAPASGIPVSDAGWPGSVPMNHPQLPLGLALRESACFASYFPGPNAEAVNSLRAAAEGRGNALVYVAGTAGLGKTHLLQAACLQATGAGRSAFYLPLRELSGFQPAVLEGLERMDLVCLDDVDAIAARLDWERAVFDLFNRQRECGGTLLATADRRPDRCGLELADLASRLGWGVTYVLRPLDEDTLFAAVTYRARARGLDLPEETTRFLLRRFPRDLAAMCELLDRLDQAALVARRRLTIPFVKAALAAAGDPTGS
jgi:DnaA family protein